MNLFRSARLKLTAFYFAVLLVFCLLLTFGVRSFTNHELHRGDAARSGAVNRLVERFYNDTGIDMPPPPNQTFASAERRQSDLTRERLNRDFLFLNLGLLVLGAILSYWYAGRTLRPIEAAHEEQKRFTSDASHELRTPLASMRLENEVFLRQKAFTDTDARELITSNLEEVARLERLATNLLALNSYENGTVEQRPVAVEQLVGMAVEAAKRQEAAVKTKFSIKLAKAEVSVNQDSMSELLTILFDNAVKYGPAKGPIDVTGELNGETYMLYVRDRGPGIADEDLPHIFERMYRGDKARSNRVSGHGIGLSLAQQIAQANGATLRAANHQDGGAVFTLSIGG